MRADVALDRRVAHHPALTHVFAAGFELRLDQRDQLGLRGRVRERRRQYRAEPDKARIARDHFHRLRNMRARQVPGVQPLEYNYARVLSQLPCELTVADIDGIDAPSAPRQQYIGKAARRSADVEPHSPFHGNPEMIKGIGELDAAPGNPRMLAALERQRCTLVELFAGFIDPPLPAADKTGEDQRLRFGPAFREALVDEELVGSALGWQTSGSYARAGCAAISRPRADKAIATM